MVAIEAYKLVKQYKNGVKALDELSLKVNRGEIFSLLGPNGAGKSSLIHILTTFYRPTSGNVVMLGKNLQQDPLWIRSQIACVAQRISIDEHMSLMENMIFQSKLYKIDPKVAKERISSLIESFNLSGYLKYPAASYSGGVKRRLDIAMNLISFPKILFLDEPTVGMDVASRKAMWEMLLKIRDTYGTTIFLTTHYLEEADQLSDTICIMKAGKTLATGTPNSLRNYLRQNRLRISFLSAKEAAKYKKLLVETKLTGPIYDEDSTLFASMLDEKTSFSSVSRYLLEHQAAFNAIEVVKPSLEEVFLMFTGSNQNQKEEWVC